MSLLRISNPPEEYKQEYFEQVWRQFLQWALANNTTDFGGDLTGVLPIKNGGTNASTSSITSFNNITGFTAAGTTGTTSTNLVFSASPTFTGTMSTALIAITTAVGKIVPGATSISLRNNADNADNILVADAGDVTIRNDLTVTGTLHAPITQQSKSTAYTTVLGDAGKHIYHPSSDNNARTFTIDSNANVAYVVGTMITFVNEINTVTIAITSDTMTLQGTGTTGSRTLAANGMATALKVASTKWVISGTGLT